MRTLYFDLETKYSADEVGGWNNIQDMGMSVGVLWDSKDSDYHIYLEDQTHELIEHLKQAEMVVGFNHVSFDHKVLAGAAYASQDERSRCYTDLIGLNNFDMLTELKKVLGHRLKLDSIARPTLGLGKSADGLQALVWYKEGKLNEIIDYCKDDVKVTRDVYQHALQNGQLQYESRSGVKTIKLNWQPTTPKRKPSEQLSLF